MKKNKQAGIPKKHPQPKFISVLVIGPTGKRKFVKERNPKYGTQ